jgi:hypothetical protein
MGGPAVAWPAPPRWALSHAPPRDGPVRAAATILAVAAAVCAGTRVYDTWTALPRAGQCPSIAPPGGWRPGAGSFTVTPGAGRGIVVAAGTREQFARALATLWHLRRNLHVDLPVEVWQAGDELPPAAVAALTAIPGVVVRDAAAEAPALVGAPVPPACLRGRWR